MRVQAKRVFGVTVVISLFLMASGFIIGERQGLLVGFLLSVSLFFLIYNYSNTHWIDHFKALVIEGQDPWGLISLAKQTAAKVRIPLPHMYVIQTKLPCIFSVGLTAMSAKVIVSENLLTKIDKDELEVLLTLEFVKIKTQSVFEIGAYSGLVAPLFAMAQVVDFTLSALTLFRRRVDVCAKFVMMGVASLGRVLFSQKSFFQTDSTTSRLLREPEKLARTLDKLKSYSISYDSSIPPHAADLFAVNPLTNKTENRYFSLQPTVSERIEKLVGRYPI